MTDENHHFPGFPTTGIQFLQDLCQHNNREWFQTHKSVFKESLEAPSRSFAASVCEQLREITGHPMDFKLFRIYRDVRFSKDKTPYHCHLHLSFFKHGNQSAKNPSPACFFGIETDHWVCGHGIFAFSVEQLKAYRRAVADEKTGQALVKLLDDLQTQGYKLDPPELKRIPSGFDKTHPRGELLKRKGVALWSDQNNLKDLETPAITEMVIDHFNQIRDLENWLDAVSQQQEN